MKTWSPSGRSIVTFRAEACGPDSAQTHDAQVAEFYASVGVEPDQYDYVKMPLRDPRWTKFLDEFGKRHADGRIRCAACWITEPEPRSDDPSTWYNLLVPDWELTASAHVRGNIHLARIGPAIVASDKFLKAVSDAGLTGLGVLPWRREWYARLTGWSQIYALRPMGRGIDHPMLRRRKHNQTGARLSSEPSCASGDWIASVHEPDIDSRESLWGLRLRSDVLIDHPIVQRLMELRPPYFRCVGQRRFIRECVPDTDFAYSRWEGRGASRAGRDGRRGRDICCSHRARDILVTAGVLAPSKLIPIATIPESDADNEVLDRTIEHPLPLPTFTEVEAHHERARRQANPPTPVRAPEQFASVAEAITTIEARLRNGTATWTPARDSAEFERIRGDANWPSLPESWRLIAPLLPFATPEPADDDDDRLDPIEFEMCAPRREAPDRDDVQGDEAASASPPQRYLVIGRTPYGDRFLVPAAGPRESADVPVARWDHETDSIAQQWPSVAVFVSELVQYSDALAE